MPSKVNPTRRRNRRNAAVVLFGSGIGRMESPEQRENLHTALILHHDPRIRDFAIAVRNDSPLSVATLMEQYDLSITAVQKAYSDVVRAMGMIDMTNNARIIMQQIGEDAQSRDLPCIDCDNGVDEKGKTCKTCRGTMTVRLLGDNERLKYVLESMEIINRNKSGGGVNVLLQNNVGSSDRPEDIAGSLHKILEGQ